MAKIQTPTQLSAKKCLPCEGEIEPYWPQDAEKQLEKLKGWSISAFGQRIRKEWICKDFQAALKFIDAIARLAEKENHHPDLHLTNYRHVGVELYTHNIGGLSENDFILAAKIDKLPVVLKEKKK
jgi:4a-hydroxytetrahydrobiopterin dehydratase